MTETIFEAGVNAQGFPDRAIATELTELEQLNLDVAAIAGWESIEIWNLNIAKEFGVHLSSISAIARYITWSHII